MWNKTGIPLLTSAIQHYTESFSQSNQKTKRNKLHSNQKGRSKTIFANDIILYVENPEESSY